MATANFVESVPERRRFPVVHFVAGIAIIVLFIAQLCIGTGVVFACLVALYGALAWTTMSMLGGPFSLGGFIVATCATIHVMAGQVVKTILGETPDLDLIAPVPTMTACVLMMAGFLTAALILKGLRYDNWRSILPPRIDGQRLRLMGTSIFVVASSCSLFLMLLSGSKKFQSGGLFGIAKVVSNSALLGISLLVAAAVLDKKKIFTPFIVFALLFQMNSAMFDASRQDFLGPLVITGMTALLFKHKFKWYELAVLFVGLWFYQTTFSPYALYARYKIRDEGFVERMQHSSAMLADFVTDKSPYTSQQHREETLKTQEQKRIYYYRTIPLIRTLDRITLLPTIDTIIGNNLAADPIGAETTIWGFRLATPSALNPDKPLISSNNFVAHKGRGLVGYRDHGTQVAMGFTGDAFISYGWWGVFFASMVLSLCMVATYRMIFGPSLLFNAAAIGVMFKTTMIFTEGTMASIITNLITFAPVVCTVFLVLLWFANALVKRRELESMTVASPALPA